MAYNKATDEVHVEDFLNYLAAAAFTGSISGTTLTVTGTPSGTIVPGQSISGGTISAHTFITGYDTGTGGAGTYTVNNTQTVTSTSISTQAGDYTPVYQTAIDVAFALGITRVVALPRDTPTYAPIYIDPPGNLRVNPTDPTIFYWTMEFIGCGPNLAPDVGHAGGTGINPMFDNAPAIWIGPGNAVNVSRVRCIGGVSVRHAKLHGTANSAFAISGGNAGSRKCQISDCYAQNFYCGFSVGQNNGSFGEVNTLTNCVTVVCYLGFYAPSGNACSNVLINFSPAATINVSGGGAPTTVIGGEFNNSGGNVPNQYAAISGTSGLTASGENFTFTSVIASPNAAWADGTFNAYVVLLPSFGAVPLDLVSFNSGTSTATFSTQSIWIDTYFFATNLSSATDFATELAAATHVYACEMTTMFKGCNFSVTGWRVEMTTSAILADTSGANIAQWTTIRDGLVNSDIACNYYTPGTDGYAHFVAQQAFPYIKQTTSAATSGGNILLENNTFNVTSGGLGNDSVVFDLSPLTRLVMQRTNILNPNIRSGGSWVSASVSYSNPNYVTNDLGEFDRPVMSPRANDASNTNFLYRQIGSRRAPVMGLLPRGGLPRYTPGDIDALTGVVDANHAQAIGLGVAGAQLTQPIIDHHVVGVSASGAQKYALAKRNGQYFSYGAALNITASYKGNTPFVNLTGGTKKWWVFPGLEILIGGNSYVVTGVYYNLSYMTVQPVSGAAGASSVIPGTQTTIFNLASIDQSPIIMQKFGRQCDFVTSAITDVWGNTYNTGDIIYNPAAAASASNGWQVLSPGGVIGTGVGTGSISGTTLTVSAMTSGTLLRGQLLSGTSVTAGTKLGAQLTGQARFTADVAGTTLTVSAVASGTIAVGMLLAATGDIVGRNLLNGTTITALGTGTGGAGTYTISKSQALLSTDFTGVGGVGTYAVDTSQTVASTTITGTGASLAPLPALGASVTP